MAVLFLLLIAITVLSTLLAATSSGELKAFLAAVAFAFAVVAALFAWDAARTRRQKRSAAEFMSAAQALIENPSASSSDAARLRSQRASLEKEPENVGAVFATAYRQLVATVVADQMVITEEKEKLHVVSRALALPQASIAKANLEGFLDGFSALVADGVLTADEEGRLENLRQSLKVPEAAIQGQLARADELRRARAIREGGLSAVSVDIKLRKDEVCYYTAPVEERKSRVARTYVEFGVRHTERELETVREGTLYFTNERLLLVADGTTNIKLNAIVDATTDSEEGETLLCLTVDRRKTPYYFAWAEPFLALSVVDSLRFRPDE